MEGKLASPRASEWQLGADGVPLPCAYCKQVPIDLNVAAHGGSVMTSRSCRCSRQWFDRGQVVTLAYVLARLPKGLKAGVRAAGV
jgi:hypothetical protein